MSEKLHTNNIDNIVDLIVDKGGRDPFSIAVWGASGSGKTYLASSINQLVDDSRVLHIDDYLSYETISGPKYPISDFIDCIEGVNPEIWDQNRLNADLKIAITGQRLSVPQFDTQNREKVDQDKYLDSAKLTIIEGAYAYDNSIKDDIAALVIVSSSLHARFMRKLARTVHVSGRSDIDESIHRYLCQTQPSLDYTWNRHSRCAAAIYYNNSTFPLGAITKELDLGPLDANNDGKVLVPKKNYGEIKDGEFLILKQDKDRRLRLVYLIGGVAVLNHNISKDSYLDVIKYYDEK